MVIWPAFRMGQYRVNDHPYHAPQFNGYLGCASATYQAPRLIQSIAADRAIRGLEIFEVGIGSSKIPLRGIILVGLISIIFILVGNLKGMVTH